MNSGFDRLRMESSRNTRPLNMFTKLMNQIDEYQGPRERPRSMKTVRPQPRFRGASFQQPLPDTKNTTFQSTSGSGNKWSTRLTSFYRSSQVQNVMHSKQRKQNDNYDPDEPFFERLYPQQQLDEKLEIIKIRERAIRRPKPFTAECKQRQHYKHHSKSFDQKVQGEDEDDDLFDERKVRFQEFKDIEDLSSEDVRLSSPTSRKEPSKAEPLRAEPIKCLPNHKLDESKENHFIYNRNENLQSQVDKLLEIRKKQLAKAKEYDEEVFQRRIQYKQNAQTMIEQMKMDIKRFSQVK